MKKIKLIVIIFLIGLLLFYTRVKIFNIKIPFKTKAGGINVELTLKLQGDYSKYNQQPLFTKVALYSPYQKIKELDDLILRQKNSEGENNIFVATFALENIDLNQIYTLFIKPKKYLGKVIYPVIFKEEENIFNLSNEYFFAGDFYPIDGKISASELSFIIKNLGNKNAPESDINSDGITDTQDYTLVLYSLKKNIEEESINLLPTPTPTSSSTSTITPNQNPTPTPTRPSRPTPIPKEYSQPIQLLPAGIIPVYNWDYAGLSSSHVQYTSQMFAWRDLEPQPGKYAWDKIETWLNGVKGYGKKGIVRVVIRCNDTAGKGDACAPSWILDNEYMPISVDLNNLPSSCTSLATNKRLNFLARPVTTRLAQLIAAIVKQYGDDPRVAAFEWGVGYNGENKPAPLSAACDYQRQQSAYKEAYGSLQPTYAYLAPSRPERDLQSLGSTPQENNAARQWLWYVSWLFETLEKSFANSLKPVYVFTGSHFISLNEIGPVTRWAYENKLRIIHASLEKHYLLGTTFGRIYAWAETRRPDFNLTNPDWTKVNIASRTHWVAAQIWANHGQILTLEQSQTYDRYPLHPSCKTSNTSEYCRSLHQIWNIINALDKKAMAVEIFHQEFTMTEPMFWSALAKWKGYFGKKPADIGHGWIVFRVPPPGANAYAPDPFDYTYGLRSEQEVLEPNDFSNATTQDAKILDYQNLIDNINQKSAPGAFIGPTTGPESWRGEGGRVLRADFPILNIDVDDTWYFNRIGTATIKLWYLDTNGQFQISINTPDGCEKITQITGQNKNEWKELLLENISVKFNNECPGVYTQRRRGYDVSLQRLSGEIPISSLFIFLNTSD